MLFSPSTLPAAVAAGVIALLGIFADHQNIILHQQAARAEVLAKINVIRAKLEGGINGNVQLARGLAAMIEAEPDLGEQRFQQLANRLFSADNQLRNVAVAPNFVVTMVYPLEANKAAIGLDYLKNERQAASALRARDTGEMVLTGPVDLVQGGKGLIGRFPVFTGDDANRKFWGLVSVVVDVDRLYRDSGLLADKEIEIALVGQDSPEEKSVQFFGPPGLLAEQPVTVAVSLPSGASWQIAAVPAEGWNVTPDNAWWLRALIAAAIALVAIPIAFAARFYADRQKNYLALHRREAQLRKLSQRLELALDASRIGVWEHDLGTDEVIWDDRLYEIYGAQRKQKRRTYQDWVGAIHPDDLEMAENDFNTAVEENRPYSSKYRIIRPDGQIRHIRTHATIFRDPDDTPKMIGAEWDVTADVALNKDLERAKILAEIRATELETVKARIEHNALHDSLTGLPNRRYLDEELTRLAAPNRHDDKDIALLHIDLDRFKQINDTLGHAAGDAMLVHAAQVLRQNVRKGDFVARIGGDEFVVVCLVQPGQNHIEDIAQRIIRYMRRPVAYEGHQCRIGVSIGIATETRDKADPAQMLVNADIALYRAKSRGRNRYEFFTTALQAEIIRNKHLADEILGGLERNEFVAYYQPQFHADTLEIAGVEALVRWAHPTEGLLTPDAFLKTADELNVVSTIDRIVLEQTLANFERWNRTSLLVPRVSVNVSARRLRDEELIQSLRRLDIRPGILSFELLESIFLDDTDEIVAWNVDRIKEFGIDIEIDDFGTGYASIVSLLKLQPRRLKIDRQLILPIVKSVRQRQLVESIIEIGKTLGIDVVAEGVETMEHARILKKLGCDKLQGHAFGPAIGAPALEDFIRSERWRTAS
ncbi:EAL domain-containing protein [Mesorhizobium sp. LHD-90]|uniref:bifunctional diguanylate cyclase/phosphodiesterase n=1 Tax=Mesorhizobium sp. LHD-90 TaxID=3071414 RepID=UPI0027E11BC7|nr:EAL domain-containing protein [Mesorhizobium sp. LHD-90]MDQ6436436.1 EAL domain-containing protein [Mesorhizobium sp. LHD-90]